MMIRPQVVRILSGPVNPSPWGTQIHGPTLVAVTVHKFIQPLRDLASLLRTGD